MHVPSDSFGGVSPERKAGEILRAFFTFVAVKITLTQLEGVGRGALGSYNPGSYSTLTEFIQRNPLKNNSEQWLGQLMQKDEMLAVRLMEVRLAYAQTDFEWDNLKRLALQDMDAENVRLMRQFASARFTAMMEADGEGGEHSGLDDEQQ